MTKNPNPGFFFFFFGGGGGGGVGRGVSRREDMNTRATIFYTQDTMSQPPSTEPYSLMKIFLMVFKTEGICSFNHEGKTTQKV